MCLITYPFRRARYERKSELENEYKKIIDKKNQIDSALSEIQREMSLLD